MGVEFPEKRYVTLEWPLNRTMLPLLWQSNLMEKLGNEKRKNFNIQICK